MEAPKPLFVLPVNLALELRNLKKCRKSSTGLGPYSAHHDTLSIGLLESSTVICGEHSLLGDRFIGTNGLVGLTVKKFLEGAAT